MVINSITAAVSEQRLPATTKLVKTILSEIFNCDRANVRRALPTLATMHVVQLQRNRGAFISTPQPKQANDVFEARRNIERIVACNIVKNARSQDIVHMRATITAEAKVRAQGDKLAELRLSRKFHMELAAIADNQVLQKFLSALTLRTTFTIGLYNKLGSSNCAEDEHSRIVQAIEEQDEKQLIRLIDQHLELNFDFERSIKPLATLAEQLNA